MTERPARTVSMKRSRQGLSLIEVTVCTMLTGLIVVGAMRCLTSALQSAEIAADNSLAVLLAEDLMEEILQQDYLEPGDAPQFGIEAGEMAGMRSEWDDVDDYDDWTASPPEDQDGNVLYDRSWKRSVTVSHVSAADLKTPVSDTNDTGVKLITVIVTRNGAEAVTLTSIQTRAWISMLPQFGESTTTGQLPPTNRQPDAVIANHVMSGTNSLNVQFDGSGSLDPEDAPLEFAWKFGDGNSSSQMKPHHTFVNDTEATIVFSVSLTVTDIHGSSHTTESTVTVYP